MKLLLNFGNSELHAIQSDGKEFVFRSRDMFSNNLQSLCQALKGYTGSLDKNGNLSPYLKVYDFNTKQNIEIKNISMPILQSTLSFFDEKGTPITEIKAFCTKQNDTAQSSQDTALLIPICEGIVGKSLFPNVSFSFEIIKKDPSDYATMFNWYADFFNDFENDGNTVVLIAQGTPAMSYGLSYLCAQKYPGIKQYYASHRNRGSNREHIEFTSLKLFSKYVAKEQIERYCTFLDHGEYDAAISVAKTDSVLVQIPGLIELASYFFMRSSYRFNEAHASIQKVKELQPELIEIIKDTLIGFYHFEECKIKDDMDCLNAYLPYLIYETLQNCRYAFEIKNYYLSVGFLFSFFEIYQRAIITRYMHLSSLNFDGKTGSYTELDTYFESIVFPDILSHKNDYKDLIKQWEGSKPNLHLSGDVPRHLLKWMSSQSNDPTYKRAYDLLKNIDLGDLKKLRNKSPMAHSLNSITEEQINNAAKGSYLEFIDTLETSLEAMLPEGWHLPTRYHESSKAIREYLLEKYS